MGGAALGVGVGRGSVGRAPLQPPRREMALGCYIHQGRAATSSRPRGVRRGSRAGGGTPRGRGRDALRVAAAGQLGRPPPHSGRALPRRWRLGEAVIFFFFFLESQGSGGGARRGACVCPFKSRSAAPASQAPGASQKNRMLLICHQTTERK